MKRYIGIDIGGTKCAVVLGDENGSVLQKVKFPTGDVSSTVERILCETVAMQRQATVPVEAVGISCGSPLDPKRGIIQSPPNLPGWDNVEIVRMVKERTGLEAVLCNDANACALAEWQFGAGQGSENMVFLTFGTGMGAGIIINGKIYNGANGNAGEIGHLRMEKYGPVGYGKQGSFEGFASGGGIAMTARTFATEQLQKGISLSWCPTLNDLNTVSAKTVADAAHAGDETALAVYTQVGEMLGRGLAILIDLLNPDCIVIGSIYQRSADLLQASMERVLRQECLPFSLEAVKIVPAALGDEIGDRAALCLAITKGAEG